MEKVKKLEKEIHGENIASDTIVLDKDETIIWNFVKKRKEQMQEYRKNIGVEKEWRDADKE